MHAVRNCYSFLNFSYKVMGLVTACTTCAVLYGTSTIDVFPCKSWRKKCKKTLKNISRVMVSSTASLVIYTIPQHSIKLFLVNSTRKSTVYISSLTLEEFRYFTGSREKQYSRRGPSRVPSAIENTLSLSQVPRCARLVSSQLILGAEGRVRL